MNAIEKEYTTTLTFNVKFENIPYKSIDDSQLPKQLAVEIKGFGYNLLKYKIAPKDIPVTIDLTEFKPGRYQGDRNTYYLSMNKLSEYLMKRFDNDVSFVSVLPDTLFFTTTSVESKSVPVYADVEFIVDGGYMLKQNPTITPSTVVVYGSSSLLDKLDSVKTISAKLGVISKPVHKRIAIKKIEGLKIEPNAVQFVLDVEKCTEKTLSLPVVPMNFPANTKMMFIPDKVDVSFKVALPDYDLITEKDFVLNAVYNNSNIGSIALVLSKQPDKVRDIKLHKREVRFIIEK